MNKLILTILGISISSFAVADNHKSATDDVIALVMTYWEARNANDYEAQHDMMSDGMHFHANSNGTFFYADEEKPDLEDITEDLSAEYDVTVMYPKAAMLADTVVLARYYLEGSINDGDNSVGNYRTRVTHIWVKEDGEWKSKSWHFSPLHNGGTVPN